MISTETLITYGLAAVGAVEGAYRYYLRPALEDLGNLAVSKLFGPIDLTGLEEYIQQVTEEMKSE